MLEYLRRYPEMAVDIVTEGRLIDIVAEGFDAGIRLAETVPRDMIAIQLGPTLGSAAVGAPSCFQDNPPPRTPADLIYHRCIRMRLPSGAIYRWEFEKRAEQLKVEVSGRLTLDEPTLIYEAARAGMGLAYVSASSVTEDVVAGHLVRVLEDWTPSFPGLRLYYPGRRHVPAGLRALIDLIREVGTRTTATRRHR
jgi:DNA-binding transcriptional LysR family regulator